jgi:opacity protein-like surface antigen
MTQKLAALAIAIALPALASASDINPGAMQLSGRSNFAYSSSTLDLGHIEVERTQLGGNLSAMYYAAKFIAFGLATEYEDGETITKISGLPDEKSTESRFLFGPKGGLDYELLRHFSVFADLTVGFASLTSEGETAQGIGWELGAGAKLFLNQHVSVDLLGTFKRIDAKYENGDKVSDMGFGVGVGFSIYLTNNPVQTEYVR